MIDTFDLIELQEQVRRISGPRKLFCLWEEICCRYDGGLIGKYELDEMKSIIFPKLQILSSLKNAVNGVLSTSRLELGQKVS